MNGRSRPPTRPRTKVSEWITWGHVLEEVPSDCAKWLRENGFDYLDHTDKMLVLTWNDSTDEQAITAAWNGPKQPITELMGHLGFATTRLRAASDWYAMPEFLQGRLWRAVRYATLATQGPWCRACGRQPPQVELHVDHIKPRSKYPLLALHLSNLQVLCADCNLGKGASDETDFRRGESSP